MRIGSDIDFQLVGKTIYNKTNRCVITKAFAIECNGSEEEILEQKMCGTYYSEQPSEMIGISRYMKYIPITPGGDVTDKTLVTAMINQNIYLKRIKRIVVHDIYDVDVDLPMLEEFKHNGVNKEKCMMRSSDEDNNPSGNYE